MSTGELEPRTTITHVGSVDASDSPVHNIFVAPCKCVLVGVGLVCGDTIAADGSDYLNIDVDNVTPTTPEEVASLSTKTAEADLNEIAPDTYEPMTLSSTKSRLELDAGDVLQATVTEAGTATSGDLTEAAFVVRYVPGTGVGQ
ncbi:MAG: hypothetical protein ACOCX2_11170 [Armatimonadota bacterium]